MKAMRHLRHKIRIPSGSDVDFVMPHGETITGGSIKLRYLQAQIGNGSFVPEQIATDIINDRDCLVWLTALIDQSPLASQLMETAIHGKWTVSLEKLSDARYTLDVHEKHIRLDRYNLSAGALSRSAYFRHALVVTFIRALRDVWHEQANESLIENYQPEDVLMLARVRAADCDVMSILAAWELRGAGYPEIWRHVLGSEDSDMAVLFARFLEREPSALFDGSALIHVFREWYRDPERVNACDHESLNAMDLALADNPGQKTFGQRYLSGPVIERMTAMPDGTMYLRGCGKTIIRNPAFAEIPDAINAAHLLQISKESKAVLVEGVPFRSAKTARRIFPNIMRESSTL